MNAELLASIGGIAMSLAFSYIPGIERRFDALEKKQKQGIMGLVLAGVALGAFGLSCAGLVDIGITCDQDGAMGLVSMLVAALVANQGAYLLTKK